MACACGFYMCRHRPEIPIDGIVEYRIVSGSILPGPENKIEDEVGRMLSQGWELYGNPFMNDNGLHYYFYQAMVRRSPKRPKTRCTCTVVLDNSGHQDTCPSYHVTYACVCPIIDGVMHISRYCKQHGHMPGRDVLKEKESK